MVVKIDSICQLLTLNGITDSLMTVLWKCYHYSANIPHRIFLNLRNRSFGRWLHNQLDSYLI